MSTAKKVTLATIKSFIRKNPELLISVKSSFDGMYDCCMPTGSKGFTKAERTEDHTRNTLGVHWALDTLANSEDARSCR